MGLNIQDAEPGPGAKPQRPGPTFGPHHNGALLKRSVDHSRRRDDDEVSLLASDEGIPDLQQPGQDLSQVCFNPIPDVATRWFPHEVITSYVSMRLLLPMYFGSKTDKEAISAQILEDHGTPNINNLLYLKLIKHFLWLLKSECEKWSGG